MMPLRVAESEGWIKAINACEKCPCCSRTLTGIKDHLRDGDKPSGFGCFHHKIVEIQDGSQRGKGIKPDAIPVWCPLPTSLDVFLKGKPKTATETMIKEENKPKREVGKRLTRQELQDLIVKEMGRRVLNQLFLGDPIGSQPMIDYEVLWDKCFTDAKKI